MKRLLYIAISIALLPVVGSCGKDFLERYPRGQWYAENFTAEEVPYKILIEGELANAYRHLEASMLLADSLVSAHDNSGDITSLMVAHREEMATHIQQAKAKEERIMLTSGFIVLALLAYSVYLQRKQGYSSRISL